jgi:hypothetical protein
MIRAAVAHVGSVRRRAFEDAGIGELLIAASPGATVRVDRDRRVTPLAAHVSRSDR